ncbi:MAG: DUF6290 family protein [Deferribacteraceae bacterium]|jgi:uncharacterized protein (DUF1778 family)|nr:DUF6290 family protein [Deferribacteraceae bacterium]
MLTSYTIMLDENQEALIAEYATISGKSVSDFMLNMTLEAIEDAKDLKLWREAKAEFDKDPVTYSNDEIMKEFGL